MLVEVPSKFIRITFHFRNLKVFINRKQRFILEKIKLWSVGKWKVFHNGKASEDKLSFDEEINRLPKI